MIQVSILFTTLSPFIIHPAHGSGVRTPPRVGSQITADLRTLRPQKVALLVMVDRGPSMLPFYTDETYQRIIELGQVLQEFSWRGGILTNRDQRIELYSVEPPPLQWARNSNDVEWLKELQAYHQNPHPGVFDSKSFDLRWWANSIVPEPARRFWRVLRQAQARNSPAFGSTNAARPITFENNPFAPFTPNSHLPIWITSRFLNPIGIQHLDAASIERAIRRPDPKLRPILVEADTIVVVVITNKDILGRPDRRHGKRAVQISLSDGQRAISSLVSGLRSVNKSVLFYSIAVSSRSQDNCDQIQARQSETSLIGPNSGHPNWDGPRYANFLERISVHTNSICNSSYLETFIRIRNLINRPLAELAEPSPQRSASTRPAGVAQARSSANPQQRR